MTEHEIDVEYVPVCSVCGEPVQLTEADDGTFEHIPRKMPVSVETVQQIADKTAREWWIGYFGTDEFSAKWDPAKGIAAFAEEFYSGSLRPPPSLPEITLQDNDSLLVKDYDGRYIILRPGDSFSYGIRGQ